MAFEYYGCDSAQRVLGEIPDPPNDVIAPTNDYKSFKKDGKPFRAHALPPTCCMHRLQKTLNLKQISTDVVITENDKSLFKESHKRLIYGEFQF